MSKIKSLLGMVEKLLCSREQIARKRGVVMGHDNFIASDFWSSEPYLIKVGSHCAITSGVKFFTHGGGEDSPLQVS